MIALRTVLLHKLWVKTVYRASHGVCIRLNWFQLCLVRHPRKSLNNFAPQTQLKLKAHRALFDIAFSYNHLKLRQRTWERDPVWDPTPTGCFDGQAQLHNTVSKTEIVFLFSLMSDCLRNGNKRFEALQKAMPVSN